MKKEEIFIQPIKTERLIIKKTTVDDIDLILKMDKQEITQKYLGGIKNKTKEERLEFLKNKKNSLTVYLNNIPIGFIGLKINENNEGEISYIFDFDYTKKGYCTETIKKIIDIGFNVLTLDKIYAEVIKDNTSSIKVLEKINFIKKDILVKNDNEFILYELKR